MLTCGAFCWGEPALAGGPVVTFESGKMPLDWKDVPRWSDVLARAGIERLGTSPFACALPSPALPAECRLAAWQRALEDLRPLAALDRIAAVNRAVNALPYASDLRNWGVADRWATPIEMISRGGDCEDYALTKYFALRDLGFAEAAMRLAIVWDTQDDEQHAVLFVESGDARWILDNKTAAPAPAAALAGRYRVIYALNIRGASFSPTALGTRRSDVPRLAGGGRMLVFRTRPVRRSVAPSPAIPAVTVLARGSEPAAAGPAARALAEVMRLGQATLLPALVAPAETATPI